MKSKKRERVWVKLNNVKLFPQKTLKIWLIKPQKSPLVKLPPLRVLLPKKPMQPKTRFRQKSNLSNHKLR
jgi:hypothetical protein